ncbi:MAG: hypothetical protein NTX86_03320 [Candidatus Dependentiae bacterium]|nr:hypothetical protein [Candidatus Dependentiae bacterium]
MIFLFDGKRFACVVLLSLGLFSYVHGTEYAYLYTNLRQIIAPGAAVAFDNTGTSTFSSGFSLISPYELLINQAGTYNASFCIVQGQANYFSLYKKDTPSHGLSLISTCSFANLICQVSFTTTSTTEKISFINSYSSTVTLTAQDRAAFNVCLKIVKV